MVLVRKLKQLLGRAYRKYQKVTGLYGCAIGGVELCWPGFNGRDSGRTEGVRQGDYLKIDDDGDLRPDYTIKKHSDRSTSMCIKKKGNIYV